jgi:hypothetical protein
MESSWVSGSRKTRSRYNERKMISAAKEDKLTGQRLEEDELAGQRLEEDKCHTQCLGQTECIPLCVPGSSFTHKATNSGINSITNVYYVISYYINLLQV